MKNFASKKLRGIVPPVITPLLAPDQLDVQGLQRLIDHILNAGAHGLFILGTTGEGPALSYALRRELITKVCQQVKGRVPVLVGITDTSFAESIALTQHAKGAGASAVVVAPPYYYPCSQPELLDYYLHLAAQLPLPFYLYNMPGLTKVAIGEEIIKRSLEMPNCLGLKDSSGDLTYYKRAHRLIGDRTDYSLLLGPEELLTESMLAGGDGGVSGGANLFPSLYVKTFEAADRGDWKEAARLQRQILEVSSRLYRISPYGSAIIRALKCALNLKGICSDVMTEPFATFGEPERSQVEAILKDLGQPA